jgi:hypothetical protein
MTTPENILTHLNQTGQAHVPYLPDLTLWHKWHQGRGTLPEAWRGYSLAQVAEALGVSAWIIEHPWRVEHVGITVASEKVQGERTIRYETSAGTLTARWSLGPDGDWWQTEYPVKTEADLPAAQAVISARQYIVESSKSHIADSQSAIPNPASLRSGDYSPQSPVVALELPMRPYSDLLHTMLGWGEGLMLLMGEGRPMLMEMLGLLEEKLAALAAQIAGLPGDVLLAPDNLDGQYISPRVFRDQMAGSYRRTAEEAHAQGKRLVVHAGGPVRRLLPLLAATGVDVVEGIAPPPQSDATLAEARAAAGPDLILWGGIPQDLLLPEHDESEFEAAVKGAAFQAVQDGRMIIGIADRVPVNADIARLQAMTRLVAEASDYTDSKMESTCLV